MLWSNRFRVHSLEGENFVCADGSVRDLLSTGKVAERSPPPVGPQRSHLGDVHWAIVKTRYGGPPVPLGNGVFVVQVGPDGKSLPDSDYRGASEDGSSLWRLSPTELGWHHDDWRYAAVHPPFLYLLVSRTPAHRQVGEKQIEYLLSIRHLLVVDLLVGSVVQELNVGEWTGPCTVESADADGVVLRLGERHVAYYAKEAGQKAADPVETLCRPPFVQPR
ncbi:MAG: hypothetical protein KC731_37310 [Myxococcales bacterium]|nr:hypothetical protein [Myxococcales bacterium]